MASQERRLITGINHLNLVTPDLPRALAFYHDVLGFELVMALHDGQLRGADAVPAADGRTATRLGGLVAPRHYMFKVSDGNYLAFFDQGAPLDGPAGGFHHLAFGVADDADFDEMMRRLAAANVPLSRVVDHGPFKSVYFMDPDGRNLEICLQRRELAQRDDFSDPALLPLGQQMRAAAS